MPAGMQRIKVLKTLPGPGAAAAFWLYEADRAWKVNLLEIPRLPWRAVEGPTGRLGRWSSPGKFRGNVCRRTWL